MFHPARALFCCLLLLLLGLCAPVAQAQGRVIVLGFDGADAKTTERMMREGKLPNLSAVAAQGSFQALSSTCAAESPVAWASLNSGQNPGKTGIAGFVTRKLDAQGEPFPDVGFQRTETRALKDLDLPLWQHVLIAYPPLQVAVLTALAVALLLGLVFAFVLRIPKWLSALLALALGAASALAVHRAADALPHKVENVVANITAVGGFWEDAARHGVRSVVLDGAMSWDRPLVENAQVLSGLGVPDVRGEYGSWCKYTTDTALLSIGRAPQMKPTGSGGRVFRVDERNGRIEAFLYGPYDHLRIDRLERRIEALRQELLATSRPPAEERALMRQKRDVEEELANIRDTMSAGDTDEYRLFVPLTVERQGADSIALTIGEQKQLLKEGQWSDWYRVSFESTSLFQTHAITRAKLLKLDQPFELFVDFLHPDPTRPNPVQPISQPVGFAAELAREMGGDYETVGWACLTHALKDDREGARTIDTRTFLEDIEFTHECRRKLLLSALERTDWKLLVALESTPDRVQHMCYQYSDTTHPLYKEERAQERLRFFGEEIRFADAIEASYRSMDRLVGEVRARLKPEDSLLITSDHGFQSFRRQCHLNNWLAEHGYLVPREGLELSDAPFPYYVDWSKTKAYAMGLGMIFLNRVGREKEGIVTDEQVEPLLAAIERDLLATQDNGVPAVRSVARMAAEHSGPHAHELAELMVGFAEGYRVSWSTSTGDLRLETKPDGSVGPVAAFSDNLLPWSGDHVSVSGDLVRGILFTSRKLSRVPEDLDLLHVAPTVLKLLGVPIPKSYDRPALDLEPSGTAR